MGPALLITHGIARRRLPRFRRPLERLERIHLRLGKAVHGFASLHNSTAGSKWHFAGSLRTRLSHRPMRRKQRVRLAGLPAVSGSRYMRGGFRLLLGNTHSGRHQVGPGIGRCARQDSVVVFGKTLRFHQRLAASVGTGVEVGLAGAFSVVCLDHILSLAPRSGERLANRNP